MYEVFTEVFSVRLLSVYSGSYSTGSVLMAHYNSTHLMNKNLTITIVKMRHNIIVSFNRVIFS